jgi:ribonuclease T1
MRFLVLLFIALFNLSCQTDTRQKDGQSGGFEQNNQHQEKKQHRKPRNRDQQEQFRDNQQTVSPSETVPQKVYDVLAYVRQNGQPQNGYVGGRRFGNFENHLPRQDGSGRRIAYQEWDVNPKQRGRNRGTERLVTGSDGRAWFTADHYNTFTEIK